MLEPGSLALAQEAFLRPAPVDDEPGLQGYLRWIWLDALPVRDAPLSVACTVWEELEGVPVAPPAFCPGCTEAWMLTATVAEDDCGGVAWEARTFSFGLSPLADSDEDLARYGAQGYAHAVWSSHSPGQGEPTWEELFVALPWLWSDEDGAVAGAEDAGLMSGEWAFWSPYYWEAAEPSRTATAIE